MTLLSKKIRNQIIEDENESLPPRHAREGMPCRPEGGHPVVLSLSSMIWIPAAVYPALDAGRE